MKHKIIITTYHFYPEINPRAFRTLELIKEFREKGHMVTLYTPEYDFDYRALQKQCGFTINQVKPGIVFNKNDKKAVSFEAADNSCARNKYSLWEIFIRKFVFPITGGFGYEYSFTLLGALLRDRNKYDILISIGSPFCVHFATALAFFCKRKLAACKIADCSDPHYANKSKKLWIAHKFAEAFIMRKFDYLTVPTKKAVSSYTPFMRKDQIKVIPQGFNLTYVRTAKYQKNNIATFAYAGRFYKEIRNPKDLLEYLSRSSRAFKFVIYTNRNDTESMNCLKPFIEKLGNKLAIHQLIPRDQCIYELSKCDFLINVENTSVSQVPSKLIDYTLAQRPIYSFRQSKFDSNVFERFVNGDYRDAISVNIEDYNIERIADSFLSLPASRPGL